MRNVAEGVCCWCRPRRLLEEVACEQNQEGSEESANWKGDRAEGPEGKFSVLSFKMSPPCHFSFWPMFFNFPGVVTRTVDYEQTHWWAGWSRVVSWGLTGKHG